MASFGIIYASGSKMIRRIIADSNNLSAHVGPGESLLTVQGDTAPNLFAAQDAVEAETGVKPAWISCAVVDDVGAIKAIIKADPAIDAVDKFNLIPTYEGVTEDCIYDADSATFIEPGGDPIAKPEAANP